MSQRGAAASLIHLLWRRRLVEAGMPVAEVADELVVGDAGADMEQEAGRRGLSSASAAL